LLPVIQNNRIPLCGISLAMKQINANPCQELKSTIMLRITNIALTAQINNSFILFSRVVRAVR